MNRSAPDHDTEPFVKLFEIRGRQVVLIDRGESDDEPDHTAFEVITKFGAITAAITLTIPDNKALQFFDDFDLASADGIFKNIEQEFAGV